MPVKNIKLSDYTYHLPTEKIASHGLQQRDQSKLLIYKNRNVSHQNFADITNHLPKESSLFFNNTKVIQARLKLKRNTGAIIEVFLLSPADPNLSIYETLNYTKEVDYTCMIGNLKKWHEGEDLSQIIALNNETIHLKVCLLDKERKHVRFSWESSNISFGDIVEAIGHTPLPPYIKRDDEIEDKLRYQTVYSKMPGAVAAPTAGLHFTDKVLASIKSKGIVANYLTLHVSAGTFQPIKEEVVTDHPMHNEQIIITKNNLEQILAGSYNIAVGTTALRTLESTYWFGVQLLLTNKRTFHIEKLAPYQYANQVLPTLSESIEKVLKHMHGKGLETIFGDTEIFIIPGYDFRVCNGLLTNFHQPGSTLILLVAAFVGEDWKNIYHEALNKNYRFLSYGDSSLLLN